MELQNRFSITHDDHAAVRGVDLVELSRRYDTPLFVYDEARLRENHRRFFQAFSRHYSRVIVYYSVKTNYNITICKILQEEGAHAEVSSGLDLHVARIAGFHPDQVVYDGLYKSDRELREALEFGVLLVNLESFSELEHLNKIARELGIDQSVGFRINLFRRSLRKAFSPQRVYCYPISRFGFTLEDAYAACRRALEMKNLQIRGLSTHIGSQILSSAPYQQAARALVAFAKRIQSDLGIQIEYLNLGGGFGTPTIQKVETPDFVKDSFRESLGLSSSLDKREPHDDITEMGEKIAETIKLAANEHGIAEPVVALEPGSYIVSDAGLLLLRVGVVKDAAGYKWAITDGGTNIFVTGLAERHSIWVANRMSSPPTETVNVVGPILYPHDFIAVKQRLPKLSEGDILAVLDAGAYNLSRSNQFLYPRPCAVLIRQDGKVAMIRERETYSDPIRWDVKLEESVK